jgi:hypothetical protein
MILVKVVFTSKKKSLMRRQKKLRTKIGTYRFDFKPAVHDPEWYFQIPTTDKKFTWDFANYVLFSRCITRNGLGKDFNLSGFKEWQKTRERKSVFEKIKSEVYGNGESDWDHIMTTYEEKSLGFLIEL